MLTPNQIPCEVFFKKHLKSSQQTPKVQVISPILQMGPLRLKVVKQLAQSHRANWRGGGGWHSNSDLLEYKDFSYIPGRLLERLKERMATLSPASTQIGNMLQESRDTVFVHSCVPSTQTAAWHVISAQ